MFTNEEGGVFGPSAMNIEGAFGCERARIYVQRSTTSSTQLTEFMFEMEGCPEGQWKVRTLVRGCSRRLFMIRRVLGVRLRVPQTFTRPRSFHQLIIWASACILGTAHTG